MEHPFIKLATMEAHDKSSGSASLDQIAPWRAPLPREAELVRCSTEHIGEADPADHAKALERLLKNRERNREHARKTRLRKKARLHSLYTQVQHLVDERIKLKQRIQDCCVASILLGLSSGGEASDETASMLDTPAIATAVNEEDEQVHHVALLSGKNGKRSFAQASENDQPIKPLALVIAGKKMEIGGSNSHINWKSGLYKDATGNKQQLSNDELESLR